MVVHCELRAAHKLVHLFEMRTFNSFLGVMYIHTNRDRNIKIRSSCYPVDVVLWFWTGIHQLGGFSIGNFYKNEVESWGGLVSMRSSVSFLLHVSPVKLAL